MVKNLAIAFCAATIISAPAIAHDPMEHMRMEQRKPIGQSAQDAVTKLVTQAKLPASWSGIEPVESKLRIKDGTEQWVVAFRNDKIRKGAQRKLYVIMSKNGDFISASHKPS